VGVQTIVVASDTAQVRREVAAVAASPEIEIIELASGPAVLEQLHGDGADLVVCDLQMSNMGAMAVCLELRLEESYGAVEHVPFLMLLDRRPDVFLARRSGAEGWLVKPLDPLRIRRATKALLAGGTYADDSYQPVPVSVGLPHALLGR
jgi:DNA-binding NarL/FixJ family response regulator